VEKALPSQHKTIDAIATSAMSLTRMVLVKLNILKASNVRTNAEVVVIVLSIIMMDFMPSLLVTALTDTTAMGVTALIVR
jgi:hypothetical protein